MSDDKSPAQVTASLSFDGMLPKAAGMGAAWNKKVRKMRRDPTISLARRLLAAPILSAEWSYEALDTAPEGSVDLIKSAFEKHRSHLLRHVIRGWMDFGWQSFEKVWKIEEGAAVIRKFKPLLQDDTEIKVDKHGAYVGLKQGELTLEVEETLLLSHDVEGTDWYGQAIMRNVEPVYDDWNDAATSARKYDQRVSGAHWVVYYPTSPAETMFRGEMTPNYDIALAILSALEANGRIAIPRTVDNMMESLGRDGKSSWAVELLSDSGAGVTSFVDRMRYLDGLKVRALGFPERSIIEGQYGTKAEAAEHGDFAITAMEQMHQEIVDDINEHSVNSVLEFNYGAQYRGSVFIRPSPIADVKRKFIEDLYKALLANPEGFAVALQSLDVEALQEQLGVPLDLDAEPEPAGGDYLIDDEIEDE